MPNIEHELSKIAGSRFYATFDLSHGYWQLPLHDSSQASQSFITPDGIFSPTRVLHGTTNAVQYLQSTISSELPVDLRTRLLLWLDDALAHERTVEGLLVAIRLFFEVCARCNLKLHPSKCILFAKKIRWCGRELSEHGIRFGPRRIYGIRNMALPTTAVHLQQFVCAMQWMRSAIPDFSSIIRPLSAMLEKAYTLAGKRTKRAMSNIQLSQIDWGSPKIAALDKCKEALINQVTLSHRDESLRLRVFTDVSDLVWSGIVTQVPFADLPKPHIDQRHQPLCFLSGHFTGAQLGWSILEKEAFAIMASVDLMHW